jgi:outer membrane protein TolC
MTGRRPIEALVVGLLGASGLLWSPALASAQETLQSDIAAIETFGSLGPDALSLSLKDSVEQALLANLGLRARVKQLDAARARVQAGWGPFMPNLNAGFAVQPKRFESLTQVLNAFDAWQRGTQVGANWNLGVSANLPTGTRVGLNWRQTSVRITDGELEYVDDVPPGLPEAFAYSFQQAGLTLDLNQSLLEGIAPDYQLRALRQAEVARDTMDIERDEQIATVVGDVLKGYLDLVASRRSVEIARISVRLADDQRAVIQARIAAGTEAPIELLRIDETVASRAADRLEADRTAAEAEQALAVLMGLAPGDDDFGRALRPVDGIPDVLPARDSQRSLQVSLERNPTLLRQRKQLQSQDIQLRAARHQVLPMLDLTATLALNGTGQDQAEAVRDVFESRYPDFTVGMQFNMPLPDLGSIHGLKAARDDLEAALLQLKASEQQVLAGVTTAFRSVRSFAEQVEVAQARTRLAERSAEAAQATYQVGRNTLRDVLEAQKNLEDARQAEVAATVQELKARVDLEVLRGTLIEALGIELE